MAGVGSGRWRLESYNSPYTFSAHLKCFLLLKRKLNTQRSRSALLLSCKSRAGQASDCSFIALFNHSLA